MTAFAIGYQHTGDEKYLAGIRAIDRFLKNWMMADDGTFYTNQKSEAPRLPRGMSAYDYWALQSDHERRQYGTPPVDHAVYTDRNGEVISAYVLAYETTGNEDYLDTAIRAATSILDQRMQDAGWVVQATANDEAQTDGRMRPLVTEEKPFLSAQAWFGTALLALHRATGDERWLQAANRIGECNACVVAGQKSRRLLRNGA